MFFALHCLAAQSPPLKAATPVEVAWWLLYILFIVIPIVAGLDKFAHLLTDWTKYLSPIAVKILGGNKEQFMYLVGVIEVAVGVCMIFWPVVVAYIVAGWLLAIVLNILTTGQYFDVAFRDLGLAVAALALAALTLL